MVQGAFDSLLIREARLIDLDHVVQLWTVLMGHHRALGDRLYEVEPHAPATWRAWARRKMDDADGILLVAELDGRIVGYTLGAVGQRAPVYVVRTVGMVFDLSVDPAYRRHGIGQALIRALIAHFGDRGIKDLQVNFDARNPEATGFWEEMGFIPLLNEAYLKVE